MLEVVLKDWVTETNETSCWSKSSTSLAKSASDRVNDNDLDLLGSDLFQQVLEGGPIERRAGEGWFPLRGNTLIHCRRAILTP